MFFKSKCGQNLGKCGLLESRTIGDVASMIRLRFRCTFVKTPKVKPTYSFLEGIPFKRPRDRGGFRFQVHVPSMGLN